MPHSRARARLGPSLGSAGANGVRARKRFLQRFTSLVAAVFGLATIVAGGRVLLGSDPGYIVLQPLLAYNTVMGFAYVGAGVVIWRNVARGRWLAGAIAFLNVAVLIVVVVTYRTGGSIAMQSVWAMTLRTVVWLALFLVTSWLHRVRP